MSYTGKNYTDRDGHYVVWKNSDSTGGHPKDRTEVCVRCSLITAHLSWNGKVYIRRETTRINCPRGGD